MECSIASLIEFSGLTHEFPERPSNFKQCSIEKILKIPEDICIKKIIGLKAKVFMYNKRVIKTFISESEEGQTFTGYKLFIDGDIKLKIKYTGDDVTQKVNSIDIRIPFSNFIVLPTKFQIGSSIDIKECIEDIYIEMIGDNNIYINTIVFFYAQIEE